ncbi:hypothetical protein CNBI1250 [Cryptococcus deneoformans B-3501A]|uniref:hypothetical protein n=1 Tax=Cryptococcus deneoformans (strain B-3501A) TaxID=283643 RepID=UPI000042F81E|nr:hypothetical protein CNBI1250 [Cryptococcus neoformans var. neoformans B-3501A]EAL18864.1 hypothetical protein CNBI1250 [Cryptococcus neoformans var. neoformans B-3501A]
MEEPSSPRKPLPSSPPSSSSSPAGSLDLPSLQPLSHDHPLLTAPTFDPDAFLLSRIHIPLEELRGELREYLGELREELVKLINEDYEEFLSLGIGLRGEEERLKRLEGPLQGVRKEIVSVRDVLAEHQAKLQEKLDERAALREEKALLDLLQRLFDTLAKAEALLDLPHTDELETSKLVTRVAGEYSQIVYLMNKARTEECAIVNVVEERIKNIKSRLSKDLSTVLLSELENLNATGLKQCLKTYELIEGWEEAEEVVRKVFREYCRNTISSSALSLPTSPTAPQTPHQLRNPLDVPRLPASYNTPLALLFNRVLAQVASYQPLLDASKEVSEKFDFFARVFWPEIGDTIIERLGSVIFAAGRPDDLHKYYTTSHKFLDLLETIAPSAHSVLAMRSSPSYTAFERRWQLPVYFQLRWKEIVSSLEQSLAGQPSYTSTSDHKGSKWVLVQSGAVWKALESCWKEDVYISELAPRFWRLSLQISSRYGTYLKSTVDSYVITEEDNSQEDAALRFASAAVVDLENLAAKVKDLDVVKELNLGEHLTLPTTQYTSKILSILTRRCTDPLKLIRSIASQFRSSPTPSTPSSTRQPSYFVPSVFKPLHSLLSSQPQLKERYQQDFSRQIADAVFVNYASTLASVKKTEDLLRKHRKSKKSGITSFFGGGGHDGGSGEKEEERFTNQMKVDIDALKEDAKGLGVDPESMNSWNELLAVVNKPGEA